MNVDGLFKDATFRTFLFMFFGAGVGLIVPKIVIVMFIST